jgi:flagellar M-ring protein FliF
MNGLKALLANLTLRQKLTIAAAAVVVAAGLYALAHWSRERDFKPLYTGLAAEDAGAIVARLREGGVRYRLADGGATVLVPSAQVAELRLQMASAGLPRSGRIGFELFDQTNFGATDFAEQVNYHRALEGELERSVMALAEVERARVHITLPKESVFLESRRPAKASVLVKLRPGARLAPQNVLAICHLVASAVEGLEPQAISVLDMQGNLLNRPRAPEDPETGKPSEALLEYRQSIEKDLLAKIHSTLEPLLGPDAFRASVSVECDFTSGEQSEEILDPTRSVMTSSQRTEDTGGYPAASGVPGTASNLPRPTSRPASSARSYTRRTENIAYQSSRTVRRLRIPQGTVKRVSVALLVDHTVRWEGSGASAKRIVEPPSEERLKAIRALVAGAVGLEPARGDQLTVESLPFEATQNWRPEEPPAEPAPGGLVWPEWLPAQLRNTKLLAVAGAAVALLVLVGVAAVILLARRRRRRLKMQTAEALGAGQRPAGELEAGQSPNQLESQLADQAAQKARLEQEAIQALRQPAVKTKKSEVLAKHLAEEAKKDAAGLAQVLRTWLHEEAD